MSDRRPDNRTIADRLDAVADLLEAQDANPFRVRAYRDGAAAVRRHETPVADLVRDDGREGLRALPGIGESLAGAIEEMVRTGRLALLDRLRARSRPGELLRTVPGLGDELAQRIHDELGIETLEELETAAHDGRLADLPGFGERRLRAVRQSLDAMLRRSARRPHGDGGDGDDTPLPPDVATLLAIDRLYREKAEAGELRRIAPRRFNPSGEAWLPVLHTTREGYRITALYSNTARAHELGRTRDWVVIYYGQGDREGQATVITASRGSLAGRRIVRGREDECRRHHASEAAG